MSDNNHHKPIIAAKPGNTCSAAGLLQLLIEQLTAAVTDNDRTMKELVDGYGKITRGLQSLGTPATDAASMPGNDTLQETLAHMAIGFQQHDSFNQRLAHIITSLTAAQGLLGDGEEDPGPEDWQRLAHQLRDSFTMAAEHAVQGGHHGSPPSTATGNGVELF